MIQIRKPVAPKKLTRDGKRATDALKSAFNTDPASYDSGALTFSIAGLYNHSSVKLALLKAQHDKCCFCESKVSHVAYGDVEHFRPKKGWKQSHKDSLNRPGYYWLAYDWDNLFFSCQLCNQRGKGNLFPLLNPAMRAKNHTHDISQEMPLFIHPMQDDPEKFIGFNRHIPIGLDQQRRGETTIKNLGLDRRELNDRREEEFGRLKLLHDALMIIEEHAEKDGQEDLRDRMRAELNRACMPQSQYSAMISNAMRKGFSL